MKTKVLVLILSILAVLLCVTACGGQDEEELSVKSIEVVVGSVPTECVVGATPDFSGMKVNVTMSDDTTKVVGFADVQISAVDTSTAGKKTVTVTYAEKTTSFSLTVKEAAAPEATLTGIKIVSGTVDTAAILAKPLDLSRLQVEGIYSDNTRKLLPMEEVTASEVDTSTAGEKTLTVTYGAFTDSMTVTVLDITVMNVKAGTIVDKLFVGETPNTTDLVLSVLYLDGRRVDVAASELTIGTVDTSTHGKKTLVITYLGVTVEHEIEVVAPVSIAVLKGSIATSVKVKGTLDVSGIQAELTYSDGEKEVLTAEKLTVTNISTDTAGKQSLKVAYTYDEAVKIELETTEEITVVGVDSIAVIGGVKNEILKGSEFDADEMQVSVTYTDGTSESKSYADLTIEGVIDGNTAGEQKLKLTYLDKTVEFTVKVCQIVDISVEGVRITYVDEPVDISHMNVYGIYNDTNATRVLLDSDDIVTNIEEVNASQEDGRILTVAYGDITKEIPVIPAELTGIEITGSPAFIGVGKTYGTGSVVVTARYNNNTSRVVTEEATITVGDTSVVGTVILTAKYTEDDVEKTATFEIKVLPITKLTVLDKSIPDLVDKGKALNTSGAKILVTFSDGTYTDYREVTATDVSFGAFDTSEGGYKKLTITYLGYSNTGDEYTVHVKAVDKIEIFSGCPSFLLPNQAVNYQNLMIKITYTNRTADIKAASSLTGVTYEGTAAGSTKFTVKYEGKEASRELAQITIVSVSGLNNTVPATVLQGATVLYENMKLTVVGSNNQVYEVGTDDPNLEITPKEFNTTEAGEKSITFTYFGYSTTVRVLVKGVESVSVVGGVEDRVPVGHKLDTSKLQICVLYTDGTYIYAIAGDAYMQINPVDTSTAGTKQLTGTYQGVPFAYTIEVAAATEDDAIIFGVMKPDSLVARESYMKNFTDKDNYYLVGDDNPFYFYLDVIMLDENDNIIDKDGRTVRTTLALYEVDQSSGAETLLTGTKRTEVVTFNPSNNSYQFKPAAQNRIFRLEIRPEDEDSYVDAASVTKSHTVKIVDGYNVYEAWELNIMTNAKYDLNGTAEGNLYQSDYADEFLANKQVERPAKLASLVLHNNLDITLNDIPADYLVHYEKDGVDQTAFYDSMGVFYRYLNEESGLTFSIHGNYYSIYSYNLPCVAHKGYGNNNNDYSDLALFRVIGEKSKAEYLEVQDKYEEKGIIPYSDYVFNVNDLGLRDNDPNSNDQSASERHIRGSQAFLLSCNTSNLTNVNIDAFMISVNVEGGNTSLNLNQVKFYNAWQNHLHLYTKNYYQEMLGRDETTWKEAKSLAVNIENSFLAKCGGPVILARHANRSYKANANIGCDVKVDTASTLYSYVTGQEAWFVAMGQSALATQILAMNTAVSGTATENEEKASFVSKEFIQDVSTINLVMVNMDEMMTASDINGTFVKGDDTCLNMTNNTVVDTYVTNTGGAPVFQSSAGGTAYSDGQKLYLSKNTKPPKGHTVYDGDYITLYYKGMGVVLEYYHD